MTIPYRPEVLEARSQAWLGRVSLSQPLSRWVLTAVAGTIALALVSLLVFGTHARRVVLEGELLALKPPATSEPAPTSTGTSGRSAPISISGAAMEAKHELDHARAGERTYAVRGDPHRLIGALAAFDARLQTIQSDEVLGGREARALREDLVRLREQLARVIASGPGVASTPAVSASPDDAIAAWQPPLDGEGGILRRPMGDASVAGGHALAGSKAGLEPRSAQSEVEGRDAPPHRLGSDGVLAMDRLQARLLLPSGVSGRLAEGDRVHLHYPDLGKRGAASHEARVLHVSREVLSPRASAAGLPGGSVVYLALPDQVLRVDGRIVPLRAGMSVRASVSLERRRLYQWLLGPAGADRSVADSSSAVQTPAPAEQGRQASR